MANYDKAKDIFIQRRTANGTFEESPLIVQPDGLVITDSENDLAVVPRSSFLAFSPEKKLIFSKDISSTSYNTSPSTAIEDITKRISGSMVSDRFLTNSNYDGCVFDINLTVHDDTNIKRILWNSYVIGSDDSIKGMVDSVNSIVNYYYNPDSTQRYNLNFEIYLNTYEEYDPPVTALLSNPLYNSLRPNLSKATHQYVSDPSTHTLYSSFDDKAATKYSLSETTLPKIITQLINAENLFGDLSNSASLAITNIPSGQTVDSVLKSTYVCPFNLAYGTSQVSPLLAAFNGCDVPLYHNYVATLFINNTGSGSPSVISGSSISSSTFHQRIPKYGVYTEGNVLTINMNSKNGLDNLDYSTSKSNLHILPRSAYGGNFINLVQAVPYVADVYLIKISMTGSIGGDAANAFQNAIVNDYSQFTSISDFPVHNLADHLGNIDSFNNGRGPFMMIQSTDSKMRSLINNSPLYGVHIDAIYKGKSFRVGLYPGNISQLLLQLPVSHVYDGGSLNLEPSKGENNKFIIESGSLLVTNKKLRLLFNDKHDQTFAIKNTDLQLTDVLSSRSKIALLETVTQSLEVIVDNSLSSRLKKMISPGKVFIKTAIYDVNTKETSVINNDNSIYIRNFGNYEVFKISRSGN